MSRSRDSEGADHGSIMVVDDDADTLDLLRITLKVRFPSKTIIVAKDGNECLKAMASMPRYPATVITDYTLPVMNGGKLCEALKRQFSGIKVILFTAHDRVPATGFDAIIRKPSSLDDLFDAVARNN
jgi:CheY-like chemotaxis protein